MPAIEPTILVLVRDRTLGDAIDAQHDDYVMRWSLDFANFEGPLDRYVVAQIADLLPVLMVIELDRPLAWLGTVCSDPATRRIPVIAIAANEAEHEQARLHGIQAIYTPEQFRAGLPDILTQHAKALVDTAALQAQCDQPAPPLVLKGLHQFNEREFFECHETLEEAWNEETGPMRDVYRAILQVAVAYLQIERRNYRGAIKMFLRSMQWFAPLPDRCQGINITQLRADAAAVRAHLEALGPERIAEFDLSLLKPVLYEGMPS